ncbi:hypothetical protein [Pseudomonas phage UF_RH7]|nr:hypothetical protein [Pseudomonas phage UF_RH7]
MSEVTVKIEIVGLADLIGALNTHTQALAGGAAPTETKTTSTKTTPAKETKPKVTKPKASKAEVSTALGEVKAAFGIDAAREIMSENGGFAKMADITPEHYDAIVAACAAKIAENDDGAGTEEEGDGL